MLSKGCRPTLALLRQPRTSERAGRMKRSESVATGTWYVDRDAADPKKLE